MVRDNTNRRYAVLTLVFMGSYAAINTAAIAGAFDGLTGPGRWLLAVAVTAPIIGHLWAVLSLMNGADEFVRAITAKRFILAGGLAIAVASGWGFAELYADAPHISAAMLYPLFWAMFGLVTPFVRTSRA